MATKTFKPRMDFALLDRLNSLAADRYPSANDLHQWLWDTHVVFNAGVNYLAMWLLRMHRGAGVWRERTDGIWGEWKSVNTHTVLLNIRAKQQQDSSTYALIENRELLKVFIDRGKAESEAVELAECCRTISAAICPPSEERSEAPMPRDDLDLLTLEKSEAKGIRPKVAAKSGETKKMSGKRPGWFLERAVYEECKSATSLDNLFDRLTQRPEFKSAKRDGETRITILHKKYSNRAWDTAKAEILAPDPKSGLPKWENAKRKIDQTRLESEQSGAIASYRRLLAAGCLPLPTFKRPVDLFPLNDAKSEWNYGMWDMAGQRVRSHLGWVGRRAGELLLWQKHKQLFETGGWTRRSRDGKKIGANELTSGDIVFAEPSVDGDFESFPGYGRREWFKVLRGYEDSEMPKHLERVAFAAGGILRLTYRTIKGWSKVRDRWRDRLSKDAGFSQEKLMGIVNEMRTRKPRDLGDQRVFEWLANPEHWWLWDGNDSGEKNECGRNDRDCVSAFTAYNAQFSNRPESITFTRSHATLHPVWSFFGENSAIKYTLVKEKLEGMSERLVLRLAQLLARQPDGSYQAKDKVRVPLRGYRDFEKSFSLANGQEVTAKQELAFKDDLLAGNSRAGTLSGIKIMWNRVSMEQAQKRSNKMQPPEFPPTDRVYAAFSCDAGEATPVEWLVKNVGKVGKLKKPRDGMTHTFFLETEIYKTAKGPSGKPLAPGERKWPREAVEQGLCVRGTDLGFRTSSVGAWWRLTFDTPKDKVVRQIGHCAEDGRHVYAVLDRLLPVSLPGDGEEIPPTEQLLRERLRALRTRLNLNNMLQSVTRLLELEHLERRVPKEHRLRKRGGISRPNGLKWEKTIEKFSSDESKNNCRKAMEQLLKWSEKDTMSDSLKAIGFDGSIWQWLKKENPALANIAAIVPKTLVPSEKEAKEQKIDREPLRLKRAMEDDVFAETVFANRIAFAHAICNGYNNAKRLRATGGLWAEFDRALLKEISYGDKITRDGKNTLIATGLLRLLRTPPTMKHNDCKDEANNLPHGRTLRGGLSMARLNFLDDVKSFVRKWSCRPRWPGNIRRLSEDEKFARRDTEHLDHLREHRAKLIAHADVAHTLGFEQDLRRGIWRYHDQNSGELIWHMPERGHFYREMSNKLTQVPAPIGISEEDAKHPHRAHRSAHVLVYEDLSRYRMRADRPKNENSGLARWSHRSILKYAQHIGGLFGVPIATVSAAYSSRFCHCCGAPGCRAVQFNPAWLEQEWMRRIRESSDVRDLRMKSLANKVHQRLMEKPNAYSCMEDWPWVLRDGGTHFVCSNSRCSTNIKPVNADENAAANIGFWFLRGLDEFRINIDVSGKPTKSLRILPINRFVSDESSGVVFWRAATDSDGPKKKDKKSSDMDGEEEDSNEQETGGTWLFRDPSGNSFSAHRWYEPKWFWNEVSRYSANGINAANDSRWGELGD